jgi:hypothetical protein
MKVYLDAAKNAVFLRYIFDPSLIRPKIGFLDHY